MSIHDFMAYAGLPVSSPMMREMARLADIEDQRRRAAMVSDAPAAAWHVMVEMRRHPRSPVSLKVRMHRAAPARWTRRQLWLQVRLRCFTRRSEIQAEYRRRQRALKALPEIAEKTGISMRVLRDLVEA